MNTPLVSVIIVTYNQEKYIRESIEGVLNQKTSFPIEIIIGEDHSTDSTRDICIEYLNANMGVVKILPSERNLGGMFNFLRSLDECNHKYIAICEGDDYWIDTLKLQKQVDFLESNPEYALVYTNKKVLHGETLFDDKPAPLKTGNEVEDLLIFNEIHPLTVLARTEIFKQSVKIVFNHAETKNWQILDYPIWLNIALSHKIGFLKEVTGVYRFLTESLSHSSDLHKALAFDRWGIDVKEFYFKEYLKKNPGVKRSFKIKFKEHIFHLRKRLLIDYGFIAKKEIFSLLKTNPVIYFYIIYKKIIKVK